MRTPTDVTPSPTLNTPYGKVASPNGCCVVEIQPGHRVLHQTEFYQVVDRVLDPTAPERDEPAAHGY